MISFEDLVKWATDHATGRSASHWNGWISASDLYALAKQVETMQPLDYYYSFQSNLQEK